MLAITLVDPRPQDVQLVESALALIHPVLPPGLTFPVGLPMVQMLDLLPSNLSSLSAIQNGQLQLVFGWFILRRSAERTDLFGLAFEAAKTALLSFSPLESERSSIFSTRVARVALHELGHLLGLAHCLSSTCAMRSARSPEGLDRLETQYCATCVAELTHPKPPDRAALLGGDGQEESRLPLVNLSRRDDTKSEVLV